MISPKIVLLVVMFMLTNGEIEDGISYIVRPGRRDCFYRDLHINDLMDFDLQVLSGGDMDISVTIKAPSNTVLLEHFQETEISQEIHVNEDGPYEICFDNTFSTFSEKIVYFDLGIDENNNTEQANTIKNIPALKDAYENGEKLSKSMDVIGFKLKLVAHHQSLYRAKHSRHAYLQAANLKLVTWFSLGSCVVMVIVGILQVVLIKSLFDSKKSQGLQSRL